MIHKCLYLTQQPIEKNDGASEKAIAQSVAIGNLGFESHFAHVLRTATGWDLCINEQIVASVGFYRFIYLSVIQYVKEKGIEFVYLRYCVNATPVYNAFLRRLAKMGVKVYLEIPTYPYDREIGDASYSPFRRTIKKVVERIYRNRWKGKVYRIVTSSMAKDIYGIQTINISNAPAHRLTVKCPSSIDGTFNLIAVANLAFWHGYDRLIRGLFNYYQTNPVLKVYFTIAGVGQVSVFNELKTLADNLDLNNYVKFIGSKSNDELDFYFEKSHLAVGCLGCHRKNIIEVKSLKNVEYAMRGIPMVYSEDNTDFDGRPYVLKVPADDSDIDVNALCDFVKGLQMTPSEIHESVKDYTWEAQMKKVFAPFIFASQEESRKE